MQKFLENINTAEKNIKTADHLIYSTFPLLKDKRILLKSIKEINLATTNLINSILQYEFLKKKIKLYKDPKENFKTFVERYAEEYKITKEEVIKIIQISEIAKKQKESPMEFLRNEKVVIFSTKIILKKIKEKMKLTFTP
jgi:transcription initiation factor TFIIIB Brf1 subunit/transcription initiation factor TFIIB